MWVTRLSSVDWVYSKTQILLATLRTQNRSQWECYVFLEVEHLSPQVRCVRNKISHKFYRIRNHLIGRWTANGWITCSRFMECGDRSVAFDKTAPKYQLTQHLETDVRQETVRDTHPNPNTWETEMLISCRMWTSFPQIHILLKASLSCTFFEDNEAVIKKIIEGRSPAMRHVSRTHKVALDWLFDRINLDSKIQIKYVDTKNQLADMLTKGSFTHGTWNHLLRLLNVMNFSMFSCSHVFLANRKQSAMSKKGQEGTSRGGTAMAKPRPMNLVSHNLSSAKKKSQQDLSDSNNPENAKAEQGGVSTSVWKQMRDTSQNPAEQSQVRQQEDTQHAESSNLTSVWKQMRGGETHIKDGFS